MKPWNVAHRGGAKLNPENTLAAFAKAIQLGCDAFELDIHFSRDRDLAVIHDDTLDRTSHRPGVVHDMTMAQLKEADPSIPSLREALRAARGKVLVEIKHPSTGPRYEGLEAVLLKQLAEEAMLDQVVVISFERQSLKLLREQNATIQTGLLVGGQSDVPAAQKELGCNWIAPHYGVVDRGYVEMAHALGLRVNTWTVNDEANMRRLLEAGCDSITSDRPDLLKQILA
ncbi:MAG: glycerophosphodiester phosphodiesterase [Candidatus Eremiobacteraeota bacterium]|nr:glycerophosphodiester phosphodiesterase [Candidatus Eremiobacteraeota bacterium]MCW5868433.1 glycerophosphodiester phosphodiesterase [Candidatus Eremiobacteraeota bacterium]